LNISWNIFANAFFRTEQTTLLRPRLDLSRSSVARSLSNSRRDGFFRAAETIIRVLKSTYKKGMERRRRSLSLSLSLLESEIETSADKELTSERKRGKEARKRVGRRTGWIVGRAKRELNYVLISRPFRKRASRDAIHQISGAIYILNWRLLAMGSEGGGFRCRRRR